MNKELEDFLVHIAQNSNSDFDANQAMRLLRSLCDATYIWCMDCDGLVVKEAECCFGAGFGMNKPGSQPQPNLQSDEQL